MSFFTASDLAAMVETLGEGHSASIAGRAPVPCVYDGPYQRASALDMQMASFAPQITLGAAYPAAHGDGVTIYDSLDNVVGSYLIQNIETERPDGKGLQVITLMEE